MVDHIQYIKAKTISTYLHLGDQSDHAKGPTWQCQPYPQINRQTRTEHLCMQIIQL